LVFCSDEKFSTAISSAIMLNVVLMLANTTSPDQSTFRIIEMIFVSIFSLEALLKTISFGHHFFVSPSGLFELIILMGSLVAYFIGSNRYRIIVQAGRIFRMMRVARFIKLNRNVHIIFQTFRASLRPITNIFFLLFLIFFIFAIVGRQLFGAVKYGMQLNRFTNFRTFQSSFLVLFQIMSGDDWHLLMTDCMVTTPACSKKPGASDCGSPVGSVIYFITYVILVVFVFVNLFVTVVLENFRSCYIKDLCDISLEDFEEYRQLFARYDTTGQGNIPLWQLSNFLAELPEGLRIDASKNRASFLHIRSQAQALIDHDKTTSKQKPRTTISAAASAAKSSAKEAYTLWKDFMDGNNHRSNGTRREIAGQKTPFFNELLRILCIHHLGIRALPYEQQRDCVKQIFIYKEKVARMLVESIVRGYIIRWRQRRNKRMLLELSPHTSSTTTPEVVSQQVLKRKREIEMTAVHADATQVEEKGNNSCEKEKSTKPLSSSPKAANAHRNLEKMITVDESRPSIGGDAAISAAIVLVHSSQTAQETVTQNLPATSCKSTVTLPKLHHDVADADMDENHHDGHHHRRHKQKDNEGEDHIGHKKTKRREHHSKGKKRYESGASDEEHHNRPKRKHHSPQQRQNRDDSSCSSDENHKHSRDSHKHREDRQHKHFSQKDDQTDSSASSRVPFCPSLEQHQKSELSDKAELLDLGNVTSTPHQPQEVKTSNSIYSVMMKSASYTASKSQRSFLPQATFSTPDQKMDHTTVDIPVSEVVEKKISTGSPSKRQGKSSQVVPT
jgi:hypothetical protein